MRRNFPKGVFAVLGAMALWGILSMDLPAAPEVVATINLNSPVVLYYPYAMAIDPSRGELFVTGLTRTWPSLGGLGIVDTLSNRPVARVDGLGDYPYGVAVDSMTHRAYVASWSTRFYIVDTQARSLIHDVPTGNVYTVGVALDPARKRIFLVGSDGTEGRLLIYDMETRAQLASISYGAGLEPHGGIVYNPLTQRLYFTAYSASSHANAGYVFVVDTERKEIVTRFTENTHYCYPVGIALDSQKNRLYITNPYASSVSVIDTTNHTQVSSIKNIPYPMGVAVDENKNRLYVASLGSWESGGEVHVVDTSNEKLLAKIPVGTYPGFIILDSTRDRLYASNLWSTSDISVIDTRQNTVVDGVSFKPATPRDVAVNPVTHRAYVTGGYGGEVFSIDTISDSFAKKILTPGVSAGAIGIDVSLSRAYVVNEWYGNVAVLDLTNERMDSSIDIYTQPWGIAVDGLAHRAYGTYRCSSRIYIIDTQSRQSLGYIQLPGASYPRGIGINTQTKLIYVALYGKNEVAVVDAISKSVVAYVKVGYYPTGVAVDELTNRIFVTNYGSNSVSVLDGKTNSAIAAVPVGQYPSAISVNPHLGRVYVANTLGNSISVISEEFMLAAATVSVGASPMGVAVDPSTHKVYVANAGDGTVSVIRESMEEDSLPPEITHTSLEGSFPDTSPIQVSAQVIDNVHVSLVGLLFREKGSPTFTGVEMKNVGGENYEAEIPVAFLANLRTKAIEYYIDAIDDAGNYPPTGQMPGRPESPHSLGVIDLTPPLPASNFVLKEHLDSSLVLGWSSSPSGDAAGYNIYTDQGTGNIDYTARLGISGESSFSTPSLEHGKTYRFGLRTFDLTGNEEKNTNITLSAVMRLGPWTETTSMPYGRPWAASAAYNKAVYVLGGYNYPGGGLGSVILALSQPDGSMGPWKETTPLPVGRYGFTTVVDAGRIYVMGGYNWMVGGYQSRVYFSEIGSDGSLGPWKETTPITSGMWMPESVIMDGRIYLMRGTAIYSSELRPDGNLGAWQTEASLPGYLDGHTLSSRKGHLYVMGGYGYGYNGTDWGFNKKIWMTQKGSNQKLEAWREAGSLLGNRYGPESVATSEGIYILGGYYWDPLTYEYRFPRAIQFSTHTESGALAEWIYDYSLPYGSYEPLVEKVGNHVYFLGGWNEAGFTTRVWKARNVDTFPPTTPVLGNEPAYTQGASNSLTWSRCEDNESGLKGYTLQVSRDENFSVDLTTTIFVSGTEHTAVGLGDGVRYFYRVRAEDFSGNKSVWSNGTSSIQDASPPETHISLQGLWGEGWWLVSPATVTFSAGDAISGVSKIYYSLDGKVWKDILSAGAGLLGLPQEGVEKLLYYSVDNVGNAEVSLSTTVRKDFSSPSSWATFPKEGGFYKEITSVNGAASDNLSGVAQVELCLYHYETAQYFTGSAWGASESWMPAQGKTAWSSPLPPLPEGRFILRPRARDVAGHVEISISSISFHVDRTPPLSRIASPLDNSFYTSHTLAVIISGTAWDARSPLVKVEISIKDETTLKFWNGSVWTDKESWVLAQGLEKWSYTPPVESGHSYFVKSRAWDSSGNVESLYNPNGDSWKTLAPMPTARLEAASGVIDGKLYVAGGAGSSGDSAALEVYDPLANTWATKAPMPTARHVLASGVIGGKLYVVGGYHNEANGGTPLSMLEVYDPATDTWTKKASMPSARYGLAASVINDKLYVAGGFGTSDLATLEIYDPATDTWTTKASMPTARRYLAASAIEDKLYVVGGGAGQAPGGNAGLFLQTLEVYDPAMDTWTTKAFMPTARWDLAAGAAGGNLYVAGGSGSSGNYLEQFEVYDPATDTWATRAPLLTARAGLSAAVINERFYAIGGYNGNLLSTPEVYTPLQASGGVRYSYKTHCDETAASPQPPAETTQSALTTQTTVTTQSVAVTPSGTSSASGPTSSATQEGTTASSPSSVQMISLSVSTESVASGSILVCWEVSPSVAVYLVRLEIKSDTDPDTIFYLECEIPAFQSESFEEHSGYSFFYNSQKGVIELLDQRAFREFTCGHEGKVTVTASIRAKTSSGLISSESSLSQEVDVGSAHAELVTPKAGKRLRGNAVTLVATASTDTARVVFQYKAASENNWHDIFSDGRAPFAAYWNLSSLSNGEYDIRSVAYDAKARPDLSAKAERVFLDDVNTDITEDGNPWVDPNAAHVKKERIISSKDSLVAVADGTQVFVPSGTLASNDFLVLEHISGKDLSSELRLGGGLSSAGALRRLQLSSGLRKFPKSVQITFPFSDEDRDGIVDGTSLKALDLKVFYLEEDSAGRSLRWVHVPSQVVGSSVRGSPVFLDGNQVVAQVDHFTIFGLFAQTPYFSPEIPFILGEVYVFPNPSRGSQNPIFHIEVGEADEVEVFIYDVSGALVDSLRATGSPQTINGTPAYEIPWTPSASGIYVAIIQARKSGEADIRLSRKFGVIK